MECRKLSFREVVPRLRSVFKAGNTQFDEEYTHEKISYTYRVFIITSGNMTVRIDGKEKLCSAGDTVFLCPRQQYSTVFHPPSFECVNIAFDMSFGSADNESGLGSAYEPVDRIFVQTSLTPSPDLYAENLEFTDLPVFNSSFILSGIPAVTDRALSIYELSGGKDLFTGLRINSSLLALIADIAEYATGAKNSVRNDLARRVLDYIDEHCCEGLTCASIAAAFSYHPSYINRILRSYTGFSLHDYITRRKIQEATRLLIETDLSMTEIAYRLAFCDSSHFSKVYFEYTGLRPSDVRKSNMAI